MISAQQLITQSLCNASLPTNGSVSATACSMQTEKPGHLATPFMHKESTCTLPGPGIVYILMLLSLHSVAHHHTDCLSSLLPSEGYLASPPACLL